MKQPPVSQKDNLISAEIVQEILDTITSIKFGSVEAVIHEGKVAQIERRERIRMSRNDSIQKALKSQINEP